MSLSNYQTSAHKQGKRLILDDEDAYKLAFWRMKDGPKIVTIEDAEAKRSNAANRYLWGPIYDAIVEYTSQSKKDIHDEMCVRFTTETISYVNPATGEMVEIEVVRRTSGMNGTRFHKFVQDVKLFGQEFFGLTFEEPGEDVRKEYERAVEREKKAAEKESAA